MSEESSTGECEREQPDSRLRHATRDERLFREQVERGLRDLESGRTVTEGEARERLAKWLLR